MNIVLVHGILGFREKFGVEYFRQVAEHLREKGFKVFVPQLDPTRGIDFRANQLSSLINAAFVKGDLQAQVTTHIIAHSMGGLDSRYMLSPVGPKQLQHPIRSLTTISTPHLGTPIADLADKPAELTPFPHLPFTPPGNPLLWALDSIGLSLDGHTVDSAAWGHAGANWPGDHIEEVGYNLDDLGVPGFPYLAKYDQIAANVVGL